MTVDTDDSTGSVCDLPPVWLPPVWERPVPERSGEAAIYSPAYLERRDGPRGGTFLDE